LILTTPELNKICYIIIKKLSLFILRRFCHSPMKFHGLQVTLLVRLSRHLEVKVSVVSRNPKCNA